MSENNSETDIQNDRQNEINYYGIVSSLIYISIILLVGIPLWWTTTSPSRHSLPDISALLVSSQRIGHKFPVCIVTIDESVEREVLKTELINNWPQRFSADGSVAYLYEWKVRPLLQSEQTVFDNNKTLLDIDNQLNGIEGHNSKGKLWIFVLPNNTTLIPSDKSHVFGRHRFFYIRDNDKAFGDKSLAEIVVDLVESTQLLTDNSYNSQRIEFLLNPEIDLIVNVVNENEEYNGVLEQKLDEIHRIGDLAFIKESGISELIRFNLNSQVLHYVFNDRFISSHLIKTNDSTERLFDVINVPVLMNTVESRVVEHNNKQSYHLLVYIPSDNQLFFYDKELKTKSNLIVTPFRGGILIWDKPNDFVNGFRAIIRNLIGLPNDIPSNLVTNEIFFTKWETDSIRRSITQKQILKTLQSLESINKLILKVSNIVIIEEIANRMHTAVDLSIEAIERLSESDLDNAYKLSTKAYLSSETAFFDPSLLSLLYFPDDQKYAVYFPLFLPVSLPVVSSLYHLYRTLRK